MSFIWKYNQWCQNVKLVKLANVVFTALKNGNNCKILGNCLSSTTFTSKVFVEDDVLFKTSMDTHRVEPITEERCLMEGCTELFLFCKIHNKNSYILYLKYFSVSALSKNFLQFEVFWP